MIDPADLDACRQAIRHGSYSFYSASRLLPAKVRDPALALYAFCRLADDAVDLHAEKIDAVLRLRDRLDLIYRGTPRHDPADRAFAQVVQQFDMPRALPDALLEGFAWDAQDRRYDTFSGVVDYSARVAAAVGAMMAVLMDVRDRDALARACDLGVAMQLTNIARDIGEDAREGRIYLPLDWLRDAGVDPDDFLQDPRPNPEIRAIAKRLLHQADRLYLRAESGISALPLTARPGIFAARHVYAGIGTAVRANGFDSITQRARTTGTQKIGWLGLSLLRSGATLAFPKLAVLHARPLPECAFLVDAAARSARQPGRTRALLDVLADLEARNRAPSLDRPTP